MVDFNSMWIAIDKKSVIILIKFDGSAYVTAIAECPNSSFVSTSR